MVTYQGILLLLDLYVLQFDVSVCIHVKSYLVVSLVHHFLENQVFKQNNFKLSQSCFIKTTYS